MRAKAMPPGHQAPASRTGTKITQATPDPEGVYEVGNGVLAPQVISSGDPEYTDQARRKKLSGSCEVELVVDAQENPREVHIVKSIGEGLKPKLMKIAEGLDQNAMKAVSQDRFKPAEYQGKPVPVHLKISVDFQIY
jgi:TonB family protein